MLGKRRSMGCRTPPKAEARGDKPKKIVSRAQVGISDELFVRPCYSSVRLMQLRMDHTGGCVHRPI